MIEGIARFAKDSYCLLRSTHSPVRKVRLWFNLIRPSESMLGFEISFFRRSTLAFLYREVFVRQSYFFRAVSESPVILDCGANLGIATLYFKWLYPKARIDAFEPDPKTFELLQRNVKRNGLADVATYNCALWDEEGNVDLFVDPEDPGSLSMSIDGSRLMGQCVQVRSRKLSEFVQGPIDLLKLDVEGAEHRILSELVISGKIKYIREMLIEYHHHIGNQRSCLAGFLELLERSGFEYQISTPLYPVNSKGLFQDVLIAAYR